MTPTSFTPASPPRPIRLGLGVATPTEHRSLLGQFLTPAPTARLLASLVRQDQPHVHLLDAGAGSGVLLAAVTESLCARPVPPRSIEITAYEIDPLLLPALQRSLDECHTLASTAGISFKATIHSEDFIVAAADQLAHPMLLVDRPSYTVAVLNPPYRKLSATSRHRALLELVGLPTTNLYTAFLGLAAALLSDGGELVAITPRSFCNGTYFRTFRKFFLDRMAFTYFHLFESRTETFRADSVLQESIIFAAVKGKSSLPIKILSSIGPTDDCPKIAEVPPEKVVHPDDFDQVIHLVPDADGAILAERIERLPCTLTQLGLSVSTGPVVDFRMVEHLRQNFEYGSAPLLYPTHLNGSLSWPKDGKKPNAIAINETTRQWLIPNGTYVLVRRLTSKEERRRVVAFVLDHSSLDTDLLGIENHLNYIHAMGQGMDEPLAAELSCYLNSTSLDIYVRQFSGHTQINASDLRKLRYPSLDTLRSLGKDPNARSMDQAITDSLIEPLLDVS